MDDQGIVFRGSLAERVFLGVFAVMFGACECLTSYIYPHQYLPRWEVCVMAFTYGAMALLFWYAAGPRETAFDADRGTYQLTTGFPFTPRIRQGSCEEIAGLFVSSVRAGSDKPPRHSVYIAWDQPGRRDTMLFVTADAEVADRVMRETAGALGLPAGDDILDRLWSRNPRLRRCDSQELVFHKPPAVRLAWGLTGKAIAVASLVLSGALVVTSGGLRLRAGSTSLGIVVMDVIGLLCLRAAGPEDLEVNLEDGTYRYRYGFPYISRERQGPLEDIVALTTDRQGTAGAVRVRLVWKQPRRGDMTLGEFRSPQEADAHLRGVAARLGLNLS